MTNLKITIQYDGTDYHGWQIQAGLRTIQGEITRAVSLLDHRDVTVYGAGRTDAGVHAEGQVASFFLSRRFDPVELRDAINGNLERDIRIVHVEMVEESFNARFTAKGKAYRYQIWNGDVVSPFARRYVHHQWGPLDTTLMKEAAQPLIGRHDFSAFTIKDPDNDDFVRTISRLEVTRESELVTIAVEADGFMRYMVRTIAGTLIDVGRGRLRADTIESVLKGKMRAEAGPTAPACGLTLVRVDY